MCVLVAGATSRAGELRKDGRMVFYRLTDGFLRPLLEHRLRELLAIASLEAYDACP